MDFSIGYIFIFFLCHFNLFNCQNISDVIVIDEDSKDIFVAYPCVGNEDIIEIFDKTHPEYYNLIISLQNLTGKVFVTLKFDKSSEFVQNYLDKVFYTDSYTLDVTLFENTKENISIFVSPVQGKGHPFPNLIGAKINNTQYCDGERLEGVWDRFIPIEPFYSAVNNNRTINSNLSPDENVARNINTASRFKDPQCGQVVKQHKEFIIGGEAVTSGSWPWHIALYRIKSSKGELQYICGGTLISKSRVLTENRMIFFTSWIAEYSSSSHRKQNNLLHLTGSRHLWGAYYYRKAANNKNLAGHCIVEQGSVVIPERLSVVLGKVNFIRGDFGSQEKGVYDVILHPEFNVDLLEHDIAFLKLSTEARFTEYVQPICLWEGQIARNLIFKKYGYVVGWGATKTSKYSLNLKQSRLPVRTDLECVKNNPSFFGKFLDEASFCAGYINGTSACNGDSGGGFYMERGGTWYLRGIISLGVSRKDNYLCDPDYYTIFTDVAQYLDFVKDGDVTL